MDICVYEHLMKDGGTPIRCRSEDEVDRLTEDMCILFPGEAYRFDVLRDVFGLSGYESEVVYRFSRNSEGEICVNFCTYEFYDKHGYKIVEFSDIHALNVDEEEDDVVWELADLSILFE